MVGGPEEVFNADLECRCENKSAGRARCVTPPPDLAARGEFRILHVMKTRKTTPRARARSSFTVARFQTACGIRRASCPLFALAVSRAGEMPPLMVLEAAAGEAHSR